MSKDVGMVIRESTVLLFSPCLVDLFWEGCFGGGGGGGGKVAIAVPQLNILPLDVQHIPVTFLRFSTMTTERKYSFISE